MDGQQRYKRLKNLLEKHGQSHLLAFWDELDAAGKQSLAAQIEQLDFSKIDCWINNLLKNTGPAAIPEGIQAAPSYPANPAGSEQESKYAQAQALGKEIIRAGKVAAFVVAGGQSTRLGFHGPKGNYPISPVKNKTLFQLFAETMAAVGAEYGAEPVWYIMTSLLNHAETVRIFQDNNYYGLSENNVFVFQQATLPNFGFDGKILMADKGRIATSPDGHGGSLKALYQSRAVDDMKKRGIEYLSYFQIDNPLVKVFDPLFVGLHVMNEAQMSSKALVKAYPKEKVGNFCLADGKATVIEYSDLPDELAEKCNPDGSLLFNLGSIAIHIISGNFIEKLNEQGFALPLHKAVKKIPHINENGRLITPTEPNGTKLETFVFDALPLAKSSIILQTVRSEEYAPVKNATGDDSAETARQMMVDRAADWLESASVSVPRKADGSVDCLIEIAPSFAIDKEDIKPKKHRIPVIKPGDSVYLT